MYAIYGRKKGTLEAREERTKEQGKMEGRKQGKMHKFSQQTSSLSDGIS